MDQNVSRSSHVADIYEAFKKIENILISLCTVETVLSPSSSNKKKETVRNKVDSHLTFNDESQRIKSDKPSLKLNVW